MEILDWLLRRMGYEPIIGGNLMDYVRKATRKDLWWNTNARNCYVKTSTMPENLYLDEKAYCVIDVSGGPTATSYPVSYLDSEPVNGWGEEYKTTKILLRCCEAGRYDMQNNKTVTITKPFYTGVFTITQRQYEQVLGMNPTPSSQKGDMKPVVVSWNEVRGNSTTYNWPTVKTVDPSTFIGRIREKTGLPFDLPTEAQWEYACRAGTSSAYGDGGNAEHDILMMGYKEYNSSLYKGNVQMVNVGQYQANFWGIFDMHGNIGQWCLDYSDGYDSDPSVDYAGAERGEFRVLRGYYDDWNRHATSFCRYGADPSIPYDRFYGYTYRGFRISMTIFD